MVQIHLSDDWILDWTILYPDLTTAIFYKSAAVHYYGPETCTKTTLNLSVVYHQINSYVKRNWEMTLKALMCTMKHVQQDTYKEKAILAV